MFGFIYEKPDPKFPPCYKEEYPNENYIVVTEILEDEDPGRATEIQVRKALEPIFTQRLVGGSIKRIFEDNVSNSQAHGSIREAKEASEAHGRKCRVLSIDVHAIAAKMERFLCERICTMLKTSQYNRKMFMDKPEYERKDYMVPLRNLMRFGIVFNEEKEEEN